MSQVRSVKKTCRHNRPVSDDLSSGLWERNGEYAEVDAGQYRKRPEDPRPSSVLYEYASQDRTETGCYVRAKV